MGPALGGGGGDGGELADTVAVARPSQKNGCQSDQGDEGENYREHSLRAAFGGRINMQLRKPLGIHGVKMRRKLGICNRWFWTLEMAESACQIRPNGYDNPVCKIN